jgi:hypothetical protein
MSEVTLLAGPLTGDDLTGLGEALPRTWNPFELANFVSDLRQLLVDSGEPMAMWVGPNRLPHQQRCSPVMRLVLQRRDRAQGGVPRSCTDHRGESMFLLGVERPSCRSLRWFPACDQFDCYDHLANFAVAMVVVQLGAGLRSKLDPLVW